MDSEWEKLVLGQQIATTHREPLLLRARDKASNLTVPKELDVVVAGAGFMALHYIGVQSVLDALGVRVVRYAGASSGAMLPMELVLLGLDRTLDLYLEYGRLQDANPASFAGSAWRADGHWRTFAKGLFRNDAHEKIDGRVFASVTRVWRLQNIIYSKYPSLELARSVYVATGTGLTRCDGYWCTDGGVTDGCPVFRDGARDQLVVRSTRCGLNKDAVARFGVQDVLDFVHRGQDDIVALLSGDKPPPTLRLFGPHDDAATFK